MPAFGHASENVHILQRLERQAHAVHAHRQAFLIPAVGAHPHAVENQGLAVQVHLAVELPEAPALQPALVGVGPILHDGTVLEHGDHPLGALQHRLPGQLRAVGPRRVHDLPQGHCAVGVPAYRRGRTVRAVGLLAGHRLHRPRPCPRLSQAPVIAVPHVLCIIGDAHHLLQAQAARGLVPGRGWHLRRFVFQFIQHAVEVECGIVVLRGSRRAWAREVLADPPLHVAGLGVRDGDLDVSTVGLAAEGARRAISGVLPLALARAAGGGGLRRDDGL
mmetsp:Transcript_1222/g.3542  ORF Transcript_1222/g.3542 Transcript_1222/m.3542 type:complete len:276 (+) Transcript_1222:994-1821(+)